MKKKMDFTKRLICKQVAPKSYSDCLKMKHTKTIGGR